ncbi:trypsin-like serine peptidase [Actinocatenispora rupis]|uniref:Peptidase S1 domain-containing protein n=1 Tax=Actinocatenispora rupis TaxID=519421 RepID=A0A8J3N9M8_9ACTN|nr:trypsin-like serine protease [Actinocatenispora rupis]GID11256.1 hypothetical protein Aru02nite_21450 [Actinocatenispora rupis]
MRVRVVVLGAVLVALLGGCGVAASGPSTRSSPQVTYWDRKRMEQASPFGTPGVGHTAPPTVGNARVGALFSGSGSGNHFCTASVVDSPKKSVLITAAHCVYGDGQARSDLAFVPAYRDGDAPYGTWPVRHVIVDPHWASNNDPDYDVAFVDLGTVKGKRIADVLGANRLGWNESYTKRVKITGYPSAKESPISCVNTTRKYSTTQLTIDCTDFTGGTSGSPWLTDLDPITRTGTVIGVIGGYEAGGSTADTSYSVYFDKDVKKLYDQAVGEEG